MQVLAKNLRTRRTVLEFTQADVAYAVGIAPDVYGRMERSTLLPSVTTLCLVAAVLCSSPSELLFQPGILQEIRASLKKVKK